jgi:pimeloyl-ACP methyl ester carboxylesterase
METPANEGFIPFRGCKTWYRIVGDREGPGRLPLLCLHGGPGASWDYFEPLEAMAATGRRVIFYEQIGSGNSDDPHIGEIRLPTLVLGGRYDEATPVLTETIHRGIPGSEWVIFENGSHVPDIEETEGYLQVLGRFLDRVEAAV